jgi:hypothetical protein
LGRAVSRYGQRISGSLHEERNKDQTISTPWKDIPNGFMSFTGFEPPEARKKNYKETYGIEDNIS